MTTDVIDGVSLRRSREGDLPVVVQVVGEAALFSRPELKVERVSYPVMTPPAATGVLESIYWKPEFQYEIVAIEVLRPIRQFTIRRNETTDVAPLAEAIKGTRRVDTVAHRDQRNAVCLRDVAYRIHAHMVPAPHADKPASAYRDQLRRRVRRGPASSAPTWVRGSSARSSVGRTTRPRASTICMRTSASCCTRFTATVAVALAWSGSPPGCKPGFCTCRSGGWNSPFRVGESDVVAAARRVRGVQWRGDSAFLCKEAGAVPALHRR